MLETRTADTERGQKVERWGHVPGLDGVRGVAVVAVLLFHGGVSWAKGGFLGVDAFFVLSGLLITSLLLEESNETGRVDLRRFWARRARRLLPALLLVVLVAGIYGATLAPRGSLEGLRRDAIATLFYVSNWRFIQAGANYFEATAAPSVLRHTWSLAIEEQFYLVWPLVMFGIARLRRQAVVRRTALVAGVGVVASASAMWMLFHPGEEPSRAYFGTDSRVQVVLTGALLAAVLAARRRRSLPLGPGAARFLGLAAVVAAAVFVVAVVTIEGTETVLFRGGFLVVSLAVATVLAHIVLVPAGWSSRSMSWAPLRSLGVLSYGLYLWHWPVYLTLTRSRTGLEGPWLLFAKLAVSGALAVVSYYLVELPIRRGAFPRMQGAVAFTMAMGLAVAAVTIGTELPPAREPEIAIVRTASGFPAAHRPARPAGEPARVLVVGDSIAKTLAERFDRPSRRAGIAFTNKGVLGCGVVRGGPYRYFGKQLDQPKSCESWPNQWSEHVGRYDPDVVLAVVGRWEVMDRLHNGRWTQLGDPAFDKYIDEEVERAVGVLTSGDATVAFTTAPYFLRGERPDGGRWPEDDSARVDRFNSILKEVVARHPDRAALLDLNERTSRNGRYTPVIDGISLRFDGVHFSPEGAAYLAPWMFAALLELAPPVTGGRRSNLPTSPVPKSPPPPTASTAPRTTAATTAPPPPRATTTTEAPATTTTETTRPTATTNPPSTTPPTTAPVPPLPTG